ncbi:LysE family translocator [Sinorhizobium alkalisoli]|uniref:Lysine transporter LysE n=1 Tax=Sinorhizobium alkalisoli TaxID=1752398 RepID=A0A1E3VID9_9HYPH|nr:LysE family transporter [Sinorhizobium alkalisoli]MCG5480133.1 LysE family transporter [Sinorhizobium alkalisoli]ODR92606.1 lysine transporter LysE [Sinorhizobium alkalisoli]
MTLMLFVKGLVLGVAIAAPLGPIGLLCINRTLERGFWAGVAGGLGTALADATYAMLAAAGFAAFAATLATLSVPLGLIGGLFMLWLGWRGLRPTPTATAVEVDSRGLARMVAATFLLTMGNPTTILSFAAIFAGLGLAAIGDRMNTSIVVAGVFLGSLAWWFALSAGVAFARAKLPERFAAWMSRFSGLILIGFGVAALASAGAGLIDR